MGLVAAGSFDCTAPLTGRGVRLTFRAWSGKRPADIGGLHLAASTCRLRMLMSPALCVGHHLVLDVATAHGPSPL